MNDLILSEKLIENKNHNFSINIYETRYKLNSQNYFLMEGVLDFYCNEIRNLCTSCKKDFNNNCNCMKILKEKFLLSFSNQLEKFNSLLQEKKEFLLFL